MGTYDYYGNFCTCPPRRVYINMRTRAGVETPSYPVTAFDINSSSMGTAVDKASFIALWNADPDNYVIGKLFGAGGPFSFYILVNSGQTPPLYVIGDYGSSPVNLLPTANAGVDQTITLPASTATLSGSGVDPDGTIVSYLWTKVSGPAGVTITSATSASTGLTALQAGTYVYNLRVTDNNGGNGDDTITIIVNPAVFGFMTQPVNQTVSEGSNVTITGAIQNGTPNYVAKWYKNGPLVLTQSAQSSTTVSATFTPANGDQFYVTVTDSLGNLVTSNTVNITVTPAVIMMTYGWGSNDPYVDNATVPIIENPASISITHNDDLIVNFPSPAVDHFLVFKEPSTEAVKTKWFSTNLNYGTIPDAAFRSPFVIAGFRYYVSRDAAGVAFDYTISFQLQK